MRDRSDNARFVRAGRTIASRPVGRSKLADYLEALVLVRPHHGRSLIFRSVGNRQLIDALERSGDFCRDTRVGGVLHPGRLSFRQINRTPGLHITLEPKDRLTAHLDLAAPAAGPGPDGRCVYRRSRALRHVLVDVLPLVTTGRSHFEPPVQSQVPRRDSWTSAAPLPVLRLGRRSPIHRSRFRMARLFPRARWGLPEASPRVADTSNFLRGPPYGTPINSKNDSNG